jgi:glucokinase
MAILAGEIGKEKSKLALFTHNTDDTGRKTNLGSLITSQTFETKYYADRMQDMIEEFLSQNYDDREEIYGACFGIAAPVDNGAASITHTEELKATFTEQEFSQQLPCKTVPLSFINDMVAIGYGIFLGDGEDKLEVLYSGKYKPDPKDGRALMLVSGGLGQALWYCFDAKKGLYPIASEGGHADFAARTNDEQELLKYLIENEKNENSPVSYEFVLSRPGLVRIYNFFKSKGGNVVQPFTDATSIIQEALQGNPICKQALDMFISIWGAQAGNLALTYNAKGGVYIGGISIPIDKLKEGIFREAFVNKEGNFKSYNENISVKVFQEEDIVLWGAARHAIDAGFVTKGKFAIMRKNQ